MEIHRSHLFGKAGSLLYMRDPRRDSFDRNMDRREFAVEGSLLGMLFLCEILVGKVGLDHYRHTVGKEADCMPFFSVGRESKMKTAEVEVEKVVQVW